ncbi:MAG: hypothetical protein NTZ24_15425, partial [Deltaproteobacteria bacterium]|nr:hypothetical protein [Deltaproteobacteria bacterium]
MLDQRITDSNFRFKLLLKYIVTLTIDEARGQRVAPLLFKKFQTSGIHGRNDMPEDIIPKGMTRGSPEHILFLTLTVSIDYQRDAPALWESARRTYEDGETRYLFSPKEIQLTALTKNILDMQRYGLSKKHAKDAQIWRTNSLTFQKKWLGDPIRFLEDCKFDAPTIFNRLKNDAHFDGYRMSPDYLYLKGNKIAPLWLRMLRDNAGIDRILNMDKIPIPVDVHVARATLALGIVKGQYNGVPETVFAFIRQAWSFSVRDMMVNNRNMIALDIDEPLWHLSKYGCTNRNTQNGSCPKKMTCELREFCISGKVDVSADM